MVHFLTDEEQFCLSGCGSYEQYVVMRKRFENCVCVFCSIDTALNEILFCNDHWILWENVFQNGRACNVMLVIATRKHVRWLGEISQEGWSAFQEVIAFAEKTFPVAGGSIGGMLFMRFGDMRFNAGTVPHLHFNLWIPNGTSELRVSIFKDPTAREENMKRAAVFAEQYEREEIPQI